MDRHDPNQWTVEFVSGNKDFCIRELKDFNNQVIDYLKQGEHKAVIAGIDRILNGLVTMINAGYDCRSHACFFSWVVANVVLFGKLDNATEQDRIKVAKGNLLDARDFAKTDTAKNDIASVLDDINKGYSLSNLADKYGTDFPEAEIQSLTNLNKKLDIIPAAITTVPEIRKKKKPWWIIFVIIIALFAVVYVMTTGNVKVDNSIPQTAPTIDETESTTTTTTTETTTQTTTETTTEETTTETTTSVSKNIVGNWENVTIGEGMPSPDGTLQPASRNEISYSFYENGRCSFGDSFYMEASEGESGGEYIDGRYWICSGGGGQEGSYSIDGNTLTIITDDNVQYGPSRTFTKSFTLDENTLILDGVKYTKT